MVEVEKEITKAEYDEIQATKTFSSEFLHKNIGDTVIMGYGLYGTKVYEKDGKYILWYERGDSCD